MNYMYMWEYTTYIWEEKKIHYHVRTYHNVIFKRRGNPLGRIVDEQQVREAKKKDEE
jgi:hypothetical protein